MKLSQLIRLFAALLLTVVTLGNLYQTNVNWNSGGQADLVPPSVNWNSGQPADFPLPSVNWNSGGGA